MTTRRQLFLALVGSATAPLAAADPAPDLSALEREFAIAANEWVERMNANQKERPGMFDVVQWKLWRSRVRPAFKTLDRAVGAS